MPSLVALSVSERLVMDDRGEMLPIVGFFDEWGDPTEDEADAVAFVAGPDRSNKWWSGSIRDFERRVQH